MMEHILSSKGAAYKVIIASIIYVIAFMLSKSLLTTLILVFTVYPACGFVIGSNIGNIGKCLK